MDLLSPFGWLYGRAANVRNALYDRGVFASHPLGARSISIGNITVGGTGKTPLVALTTQILAERGAKVCILTRGYGRKQPARRVLVSDGETVLADAETGGDEPVELAHRLRGKVVIIADSDRVAAARWAVEKFGVTAFVLDDGFQHRRAKRDLDIVCIDATDPFGSRKMLPAGRLREPLRNLGRADAIIITRADLVDSTDEIREKVRGLNSKAVIFTASNSALQIVRLEDFLQDNAPAENANVPETAAGAVSVLRDRKSKQSCGPAQTRRLPYWRLPQIFRPSSLLKLRCTRFESEAAVAGCSSLLTTAKDAVKLVGIGLSMPCFVVRSELDVSDLERFSDLVASSSAVVPFYRPNNMRRTTRT